MPTRPRLPLPVTLFLCAVAAAGLARAESTLLANLSAGKPQTVVVYGTSLTANGAWVAQLRDWLDAQHPGLATIVNSGMSGKASQTALDHLQERVLAKNPDTVFIEFATNDAFTAYKTTDADRGITPAESKANLVAMIDAIRAARPGCEIILQTMNPAWDAPNGNGSGSKRPNLARYFEGYREVARERGLLLIDHYPKWKQLQRDDPEAFKRYVADGIHPNAEGYEAVVTPLVRAALLGY